MKQRITLEVDLSDFCAKAKDDVVIMKINGKWQGVHKEEFLKVVKLDYAKIKDELNNYKQEHAEMKHQIEKFKKALLIYGFNTFEEEDKR